MKKFLVSSIILLFLASCGGGGGSSTSPTDPSDPNFDPYPNDQVDDNNTQDDSNTTEIISEATMLKPSNILAAFEKYGYTFSTLNLKTSFRGSVDYQTYMYFTNQSNTVAVLGDYVYALTNNLGQRLLVTIDAPSQFDTLERSSELILRANYSDSSASLRYLLPFTPKGYLNINTTRTNASATVGTLLSELANAFNQFILINPNLTKESLTYSTDPTNASSFVVCNNQEFALDSTQRSISFSNSFALEEMVNCSTKNGVLIGSIYTPDPDDVISTVISGDLFKSIVRTTSQVEGIVTTNKDNLSFTAQKVTGKYGTFEILSSGSWIYILDTLNTSIQELTSTQSLSEQFTITTGDNTQATVEVTIQGADDVVDTIISGDLFKSVSSSLLETTGNLYANKDDLLFVAQQLTGQYGEFNLLSDGSWTYLLNREIVADQLANVESLKDTFDVQTTDNTHGVVEITIEKAIDNPTDFAALTMTNVMTEGQEYQETILDSGKLGGTISDADGISFVEIVYSDAISNSYSNGSIDNETAHRFNTTFTITVTDNLGNVATHSGSIYEQNEATNFDYLSIYHDKVTNTARLEGTIKDYNGVQSVTISYSDGGSNTLNGNGESHFYLYDQPSMPYGISYTIEVTDSLGNKEQHNNMFEQPTYYPTDFNNVQILSDDGFHSYLSGSISDENGISYVYIEYSDSFGNNVGYESINGDGNNLVSLSGLTPQGSGITYKIYVYDMIGDQAENTGTFSSPSL